MVMPVLADKQENTYNCFVRTQDVSNTTIKYISKKHSWTVWYIYAIHVYFNQISMFAHVSLFMWYFKNGQF